MSHLRFRIQFFLCAIFINLLAGTLGFNLLEGLSFVDAFYFSIVTITTVGYGDIHPVTSMGKALAIFLIITGVGTFLGAIASATDLILTKREQIARLEKLNVIIGVFFSEVGTKLLADFSKSDAQLDSIRNDFIINSDWSDKDFNMVSSHLSSRDFSLDMGSVNLESFHRFLENKSNFLLRIMENPNLLEHEAFTDLLMAVFHLKEELIARKNFKDLPESDIEHLAGDMSRSYKLLVFEWLLYMRHLQKNYPYLFSLAMRVNPFDTNASPIIT